MDQALFLVLRQYSCLAPPNKIGTPLNISRRKFQDFLTEKILNNALLSTYSPSAEYQRSFWKKVIGHLETNYDQDEDFELSSEIYDHYIEVLQDSHAPGHPAQLSRSTPLKSYITYHWKPPGVKENESEESEHLTTTLLESRNMIESGTTGLRTWTAAFFMAQYLLKNPDLIVNRKVLEFGSGIGFLGTVIGAVQVLSCPPDTPHPKVWLTDVDDTVLALCRDNVNLPCNISSAHTGIETCKLDWYDSLDESQVPKLRTMLRGNMNPDLIVGCDIVFDPSLIVPLLSTLKLAIEDSDRTALLALTVRNQTTFSKFLDSARELCLEVVDISDLASMTESILPRDVIEDLDAVRLLRLTGPGYLKETV